MLLNLGKVNERWLCFCDFIRIRRLWHFDFDRLAPLFISVKVERMKIM